MASTRTSLSLVALLSLVAPGVRAQDASTVTVDAVLVDVVVVDEEGNPMTGLSAADFEVRENGKLVELTDFEEHRRGGSGAGAAAPAPPSDGSSASATAPAGAPAATAPGATFILLFDQLGTTPHAMKLAKRSAEEFLGKSVSGGDLVSVYRYDGYLHLVKALTTEHALCAQLVGADDGEGAWRKDLPRSRPMSRSAALALVASLHDDVPGRKTLVSFGRSVGEAGLDGDALEPGEQSDDESNADEGDVDAATLAGYDRVIAAMSAANVAVFPVDPDGAVQTPADARGGAPSQRSTGYGAAGGRDPRPRQGRSMGERRGPTSRGGIAQGKMAIDAFSTSRMLAEDTGGEAVIYGEKLDEKLRRIADLASNYYLVGYTPPTSGKTLRRLQITVKREGARVLSRKGYYAGFATSTVELEDLTLPKGQQAAR